jgi:hypothetical protein
VLPLNKRISLAYTNKIVKSQCDTKNIIEDGLNTIRDRIKNLEEERIIAPFKPSKTAIQAVSFLSRENINELKNNKKPLIKNIFRILNTIINKNDESDELISNFLNNNDLGKVYLFSHMFIKQYRSNQLLPIRKSNKKYHINSRPR